MKKRTDNSLKVVDIQEKVKEQAEVVKEQYLGWMELNRNFLEESLKAMDMQLEMWLAMQLGCLDFMKNVLEIEPAVKPFEPHLNHMAAHFETICDFSREIIEMKKRKAEKFARTLKSYHRKNIENTISAFDKYCDMLSTT